MKSLQFKELFLLGRSLPLAVQGDVQLNYTLCVHKILLINISNDGAQTLSWEEKLTIREILIINEIYQ